METIHTLKEKMLKRSEEIHEDSESLSDKMKEILGDHLAKNISSKKLTITECFLSQYACLIGNLISAAAILELENPECKEIIERNLADLRNKVDSRKPEVKKVLDELKSKIKEARSHE